MSLSPDMDTDNSLANEPPVALTVDLVILSVRHGGLTVLLAKDEARHPGGVWGLPGGSIGASEDVDEAADRLLFDATGLQHSTWHVEQLRTYVPAVSSAPDGGSRSATIAYISFMPVGVDPLPGSMAEAFRWWAVDDLWDDGPSLALSQSQIILDGVDRCRSKLEYTTVAASFLEEPFTLGELRRVYESVWGVKLHHSNFARKLTSSPGYLTAEFDGSPGRASLYRRGDASYVMPPILRPTAEPT